MSGPNSVRFTVAGLVTSSFASPDDHIARVVRHTRMFWA
jgi:hypothetical protein